MFQEKHACECSAPSADRSGDAALLRPQWEVNL